MAFMLMIQGFEKLKSRDRKLQQANSRAHHCDQTDSGPGKGRYYGQTLLVECYWVLSELAAAETSHGHLVALRQMVPSRQGCLGSTPYQDFIWSIDLR